MTLETLITILIILIIGIIIIKAIRWLLSICLLLVLLYFSYYTFFTYPGAFKLSVFKETFDIKSYHLDKELIKEDGTISFNPPLEIGKYKLLETSCKTHKVVILCESTIEEEE